MTNENDRISNLEAVAEWAQTAMDRRDLYENAKKGDTELDYDWLVRRDALWQNVRSADAMLNASLKRLHESEVKRAEIRPKIKAIRHCMASGGGCLGADDTCPCECEMCVETKNF